MDKKIVVIGDAMLDIYVFGNTDRKNPESPMPLLKVERQETRLGGASNVANNIAKLNGSVKLVSLIGTDTYGELFDRICEENNIKVHWLIMDAPTITKTRYLDSQYKQQLLRVDFEEKKEISIEQIKSLKNILNETQPEIILISDYNKGIITPLCVDIIKDYANENNVKILADIKPQNLSLFEGVFLIKPNFKEFCKMMDNPGIENTDEDIEKYGLDFVKQYSTNLVVTRGGKGSSLITKEGKVYHVPSEECKVFDVTGAGDTHIATLTYALSEGYELIDAVKLANKASGIVVGKVGTASITKEELGI